MAYALADSFIGGVDRTRKRYAPTQGTIWSGINGHIGRGGDFEKRKAFQATYALPTGTKGLAKSATGLVVFGIAASVSGLPVGISYQQVAHNTTPSLALDRINSWDLYNGYIYAIAKYDNGDYRHFYNGSLVTDWGAGGNSPSGYGSIVRTHRRKVYSAQDSLLWFSELDSATNFDTTASGSGYVNLSNHQSGSDSVTGMCAFQSQLAIFSRYVVQLWNMADDDANNAPAQYLNETGTRAPRSVVGFGDIDAFYLSDSGIRSIRARSGTNTAGVNDVGTPIDPLIAEYILTLTSTQIERACGIVEPVDGRFWLALGERIFVFSYFPSKKVSAWTWYEPGLEFTDIVSYGGRIYARAGDVIYLYGGTDNDTYDSCEVTLAMPYLSSGKPGHYKAAKGVDVAAEGEWTMTLLVNPRDENEYVDAGTIEGFTFNEQNIGALGHVTHVAPVLVHEAAGAASVSQVAAHYEGGESDG